MQTVEQIDIQCAKVGTKLHDLTVEIHDLFQSIDYGPALESDETNMAFERLQDVRNLIDVASNIYPYPTDI